MDRITAVRGVKDILPEEAARWERVERVFRDVLGDYGYGEIRLPVFEETRLFQRGIGDTTDIVEKEMYTFADKGGTSITLRPEGTASAVRAYIEHDMAHRPQPVKLWYLGPMFRHERPQKGRLRQFHQVGAEIFGVAGPEADAELVEMLMHILSERLGLQDLQLQVNTLGDDACRPAYRAALKDYLASRTAALCDNCRRRLETNPLRILDCKAEGCKTVAAGAPVISGHLCGGCREHFDAFRSLLDAYGVPHAVNEHLMRGLDYYGRTTFEIVSTGLGAQNAVAGGGRYDGLVAMFGGPPTPGLGWALGMERLLSLIPVEGGGEAGVSVYVSALDDAGRSLARTVARDLRHAGVAVQTDFFGRSLKAQLRAAGRDRARLAVILGGDELARGEAVVKDMAVATQSTVPLPGLVEAVRGMLP